MNLLAMHDQLPGGGQPQDCTCPRSACGGTESGPNVPASGCTSAAHGLIATKHHHAFDCPALPADTDLSHLWLIVTLWTDQGPIIDGAEPFDRATLAALRDRSALWDVTEGATLTDAIRTWQAHIDAMRADAARRQAQEVADIRERARLRKQAQAELLRHPHTRASRILAAPGDL